MSVKKVCKLKNISFIRNLVSEMYSLRHNTPECSG